MFFKVFPSQQPDIQTFLLPGFLEHTSLPRSGRARIPLDGLPQKSPLKIAAQNGVTRRFVQNCTLSGCQIAIAFGRDFERGFRKRKTAETRGAPDSCTNVRF
jgi:hypothetical protein